MEDAINEGSLAMDSEIVQLIDNIAQEIDTTIYLLKFKA